MLSHIGIPWKMHGQKQAPWIGMWFFTTKRPRSCINSFCCTTPFLKRIFWTKKHWYFRTRPLSFFFVGCQFFVIWYNSFLFRLKRIRLVWQKAQHMIWDFFPSIILLTFTTWKNEHNAFQSWAFHFYFFCTWNFYKFNFITYSSLSIVLDCVYKLLFSSIVYVKS